MRFTNWEHLSNELFLYYLGNENARVYLYVVMDRVPEINRKMDLRQIEQGFSSIFVIYFAIL